MENLSAFPKIFALGSKYITNIFVGPVEITEKVDGLQFVFGKIDGELKIRSKGAIIIPDAPPKMFKAGVEYVLSLSSTLPDNTVFYCEYLSKPKHNVLKYDRIPLNYLVLFGVQTPTARFLPQIGLDYWAKKLKIDIIPLLYSSDEADEIILSAEETIKLLACPSFLGGTNIEGIVVKNFREFWVGDRVFPIMSGKYVSEAFKEVHRKTWASENSTTGKWEKFKEGFCTEARWLKAIQHLKEEEKLLSDPKDIGSLINEVKKDIGEEEKEEIKTFLWRLFGKDLLHSSVKGLPEWYKKHLALGED